MAARQINSIRMQPEKINDQDAAHNHHNNVTLASLETRTRQENCLHELEDALGIAQHHDGVSGTAKQHVANDYTKRIQSGIDMANKHCILPKLKKLLLENHSSKDFLQDFAYCQLLNETKCSVSQAATTKGHDCDIYVVVYNSLASDRSTVVRLPVSENTTYNVSPIAGDTNDYSSTRNNEKEPPLPSRIISSTLVNDDNNSNNDGNGGEPTGVESFVLIFETGLLPPVGAATFRVTKSAKKQSIHSSHNTLGKNGTDLFSIGRVLTKSNKEKHQKEEVEVEGEDFVVSNGLITARFNRSTGAIKQYSSNNVTVDVSQIWGYYTSFDSKIDTDTSSKSNSNSDQQNSGAYIFRPSSPEQKLITIPPKKGAAKFRQTSVGTEITIEFEEAPWIRTTTRVLSGQPYIEVEYTIGPIPIDDRRGKEIVTRFNTPIKNGAVFYTDSNAREFVERRRNHRPTWDLNVYEPVAGNYYPVGTAAYIEDPAYASFAVVTDRSLGGASLFDGSIELMLQRRILADDGRGVGEPMNETTGGVTPYPPYGNATRIGDGIVVKGRHRIIFGTKKSGASIARSLMDSAFAEPLVFVGSSCTTPSSTIRVDQENHSRHQQETISKKERKENTKINSFPSNGIISALRKGGNLPHNVMLVTLMELHSTSTIDRNEKSAGDVTMYLVRLGHQYAVGEHELWSKPVNIDLSILFPDDNGNKILDVLEMTLSNNQEYSSNARIRYDWLHPRLQRNSTHAGDSFSHRSIRNKNDLIKRRMAMNALVEVDISSPDTIVHLKPMDIRTFRVKVG